MTWVLAVAFTLSPNGDSWFGRDKAKHFLAGAAVQSLAYSAWREGGASSRAALWGATAATGLGMEGGLRSAAGASIQPEGPGVGCRWRGGLDVCHHSRARALTLPGVGALRPADGTPESSGTRPQ